MVHFNQWQNAIIKQKAVYFGYWVCQSTPYAPDTNHVCIIRLRRGTLPDLVIKEWPYLLRWITLIFWCQDDLKKAEFSSNQ